MNTLTTPTQALVTFRIRKITFATAAHFWKELEKSRFAVSPLLLVILASVGGIAAGFGINDSTLELTIVAIGTVVPLALLLAVSPMKPVFYLSILAVVLDLLVLIF